MTKIDADKLIQKIQERIVESEKPFRFKWYTKQGYAKWMSAEAVLKERKEIIKIIQQLAEE